MDRTVVTGFASPQPPQPDTTIEDMYEYLTDSQKNLLLLLFKLDEIMKEKANTYIHRHRPLVDAEGDVAELLNRYYTKQYEPL